MLRMDERIWINDKTGWKNMRWWKNGGSISFHSKYQFPAIYYLDQYSYSLTKTEKGYSHVSSLPQYSHALHNLRANPPAGHYAMRLLLFIIPITLKIPKIPNRRRDKDNENQPIFAKRMCEPDQRHFRKRATHQNLCPLTEAEERPSTRAPQGPVRSQEGNSQPTLSLGFRSLWDRTLSPQMHWRPVLHLFFRAQSSLF